MNQIQKVTEAFSRQAPTFENPRLNTAFVDELAWLCECVDPKLEDLVLDVAAGSRPSGAGW